MRSRSKGVKEGEIMTQKKRLNLVSYPISLEVDENSSSHLGDKNEQQAGEVLWRKKGICVIITTVTLSSSSTHNVHESSPITNDSNQQ